MDEFEISSLWDAVNFLEIADTLLYAFFEDYFEDMNHEELKHDAKYRPELMEAKMRAILEYIYKARLFMESVVDPASKLVGFYLEQAGLLKKRIAKAERKIADG